MSALLLASASWDLAPWAERFARALPGRPVHVLGEAFDPEDIAWAATWYHPPGSLKAFPNLRGVFSLGAGVDHLLKDPDLPDVPLARVVIGDLTERMSEYVVLHCLAHLRQAHRYAEQQRRGLWEDDRDQPAARDVRVGIMGMGELGGDAAKKLAVMGFDVAGWSRTDRAAPVHLFSGREGLDGFLARTDILVCLLPLTDETRGLLGRPLFEGLARDGRLGGPVLINAGRGGLQVEADILACLDDGTLRAATLDVFETEPLPKASPLWSHPAVTVTPHNAAMSAPEAISGQIADQIRAVEAGGDLRNRVERARGY